MGTNTLPELVAAASILVYVVTLIGFVLYKLWRGVLSALRKITKRPWILYRRTARSLRWPEEHLPRAVADKHRLIDDLGWARLTAQILGWGSIAFPIPAMILMPLAVNYEDPGTQPNKEYISWLFSAAFVSYVMSFLLGTAALLFSRRYSSSDMSELASAGSRLIEILKTFRFDSPRDQHASVASAGRSFETAALRAGMQGSDPRLVRIKRAYMDGQRGRAERTGIIGEIQDILVAAYQGDFEQARVAKRAPLGFLASETHLKFILGCIGLVAAAVTFLAAVLRIFAQ